MTQYWILKTEPSEYSLDDLVKDRSTYWNKIRNYQARNFLKQMKVGDGILIYHSGSSKSVVGSARVISEAENDPDRNYPPETWVKVEIRFVSRFKKNVPLKSLKSDAILSEIPLIKQSRLSVAPVTGAQFRRILRLGTI